jgi:4-amino-4-deoxy-L-arabinose transferase-like glycosyltransferase
MFLVKNSCDEGKPSGIAMPHTQIDTIQTTQEIFPGRGAILRKIAAWLCVWEIYPILAIAAFLRFYQLTTTEFDADQALILQMARDAINHGLIPVTGIIASIRIANPPAVVYLFMIPAAISSNPLCSAIFVGLLNVIGVLLTYIFVRRYYGRIASIIASLLYATAAQPLHFNRFIWQVNIIAPFVVLFIFALFWGVVDRRKGWLLPALLLLGVLIQLHVTLVILSSLVLVALLLSPATVRLRDLALGLFFLALLFSSYLLWEFAIKFDDLNILLHLLKLHSHFDLTALNYYELLLNPYGTIPTNTHSLEYTLIPLLKWLSPTMAILIVCALTSIMMGVISSPHLWKSDSGVYEENRASRYSLLKLLQRTSGLWNDFRAAPKRCGYFLLLSWQIVPIIILSRHSVPVFPYYLLMVLPGPFIIIGILLSTLAYWFKRQGGRWRIAHYGVYACTFLVIVAQLLGSTAGLIDEASGNNLHGYSYNTLNSLEDALNQADQLVSLHHLNHVYIATDQYTQNALYYLGEQSRIPTTLFDASRCLVLPDATAGPAALLIGPSDTLSVVLLRHFARATLVSRPERLGGMPFQLYIIEPIAVSKLASSHEAFEHHLQLLDSQIQQFNFNNSSWLTTRWSYTRSAAPRYRTTYTYTMMAQFEGKPGITSQCTSTSIRVGDQLIVTFPLWKSSSMPSSITIRAKSFTTIPLDLAYGSFHFENIRDRNTQPLFLQTPEGKSGISLSTS